MIHLRNKLAEAELHAAEYYIKRKAWLAAAKRGQYVVENYQTTPASRKALAIMVRAYNELGLKQLAADAQLVLNTNTDSNQQVAQAESLKELQAPSAN